MLKMVWLFPLFLNPDRFFQYKLPFSWQLIQLRYNVFQEIMRFGNYAIVFLAQKV